MDLSLRRAWRVRHGRNEQFAQDPFIQNAYTSKISVSHAWINLSCQHWAAVTLAAACKITDAAAAEYAQAGARLGLLV